MTIRRFSWLALALFLPACDGATPPADGGADAEVLSPCLSNRDCDDALFCNGVETCAPADPQADAAGCVSAAAPVCADDLRCDEDADACLPSCADVSDSDGDGHDAIACGGDDCDDANANRFPGNVEVCDLAGNDEDCDVATLGFDLDSDGFVSSQCCNIQPDGGLRCGQDCNDASSTISPTAQESCNQVDDNCNGEIDEGVLARFFPDCDGDDFGAIGASATESCIAPSSPPDACAGPGAGWADADSDCDDNVATVNPGAPESCDGIDNDCNGILDGPDADRDDDGSRDCLETCVGDPNQTASGVCACGEPTEDRDGDGVPRCQDECPDDAGKVEAGVCGCGRLEDPTDADLDGVADCAGMFGARRVLTMGDRPEHITLADLNGDGRLDLVTANDGFPTETVSIRLANTFGAFGTEAQLTLRESPSAVATGDLNGDDVPDLLVTYSFGDGISIRLGVGDGTFGAETLVDINAGSAIATADMNGDGSLDVVTSRGDLLLGNGAGGLGAALSLTASSWQAVALGDLDRDGAVDVVLASAARDEVGVLLGVGDGTFGPATSVAMGGAPRALVLADVNGDASPDIVTGNRDSMDLSVRLGLGDGTVGAETRIPVGTRPLSLAVGDFDADGLSDVLIAEAPPRSSVLRGNGDGTLERPVLVDADFGNEIATGDIDGDGVPDFVGVDRVDDSVAIRHALAPPWFGVSSGWLMARDPVSLSVADLDRDGRLDLIDLGEWAGEVSIRLGGTRGQFGSETAYSMGDRNGHPTSLVAADLNDDGVFDLLSANEDRELSVRLGVGDGTFGVETIASLDRRADFIADGDLNGDGRVDLVLANEADDTVTVKLSNGDGTFGPPTALSVDDGPVHVALHDLDGDGSLDVLTANALANTISVRLGAGDGSFGVDLVTTVGSRPVAVAARDLNQDGVPDLVSANEDSDDVSVRLGNGDGTFGPETRWEMGDRPIAVLIADVDGDSRMDVIAACSSTSSTVVLRRGRGNGELGPIIGVGNREADLLALGDIDGDGATDIVSAISFNRQVRVNFGRRQTLRGDLLTGTGPRKTLLVDLTRDGAAELVTTNIGADTVSVHLNDGRGGFLPPTPLPVGEQPTGTLATDLDADGNLDLAVTNEISGDVSILLGSGDGTFGVATQFSTGLMPQAVVALDVDLDGNLDLLTADAAANTVSILHGDGDGSFALATALAVGDGPFSIAVGDVDADGSVDVVTANSRSNDLSLLMAQGDGTFANAISLSVGELPRSVVLADVNGDGRLDIAAANEGSDSVSLLVGNGDGSFAPVDHHAVGQEPQAVVVVDWNDDGVLDLVTANEHSNDIAIRLGNGDATFGPQGVVAVGVAPQSVAFGDLNADGRVELVCGNEGSDSVSVIRRVGLPRP